MHAKLTWWMWTASFVAVISAVVKVIANMFSGGATSIITRKLVRFTCYKQFNTINVLSLRLESHTVSLHYTCINIFTDLHETSNIRRVRVRNGDIASNAAPCLVGQFGWLHQTDERVEMPLVLGEHTNAINFYQRVSIASYANRWYIHRRNVRLFICLSVRHTPVLYQNEES